MSKSCTVVGLTLSVILVVTITWHGRVLQHPKLTTPVGTGAAFSTKSLGDESLTYVPGLQRIVLEDLGRKVNVTQHACGFTMTVQRVYADPQRVIIGYTLTGPAHHTFVISSELPPKYPPPVLTDAHGGRLANMAQFVGPATGNAEGQALEFDGSRIATRRGVLTLHLVMPVVQLDEQRFSQTSPCATYTRPTTATQPRVVIVKGPFVYDLSVPIAPMHAAPLQSRTQINGLTMTLQRVAVTPINTSIYLTRLRLRPTRYMRRENVTQSHHVCLY